MRQPITSNTINETELRLWVEGIANRAPKPCRWFGVEIESPEVAHVIHDLSGWESVTDGSVEQVDCECDCDSCEHSCDCNRCDYADYDPDHCGNCSDNEMALNPPANDTHADGEILAGCLALQGVESRHFNYDDEAYGGHVHVEGRDLDIASLVRLVTLYNHAIDAMPDEFAGRSRNRWCEKFGDFDLQQLLAGRQTERNEVNLQNLIRYRDRHDNKPQPLTETTPREKSTVEFRRFASTNDPALTIARVAFLVALVEFAKSKTPIYWVTRSTEWQEITKALGV